MTPTLQTQMPVRSGYGARNLGSTDAGTTAAAEIPSAQTRGVFTPGQAASPRGPAPLVESTKGPFAYLAPRIRGKLTQVIDPEIRKPITQLGMVASIIVDDTAAATVTIRLTTATCPKSSQITHQVEEAVASVTGVTGVTVVVEVMTPADRQALIVRLRGAAASRRIRFGAESTTRVYAVTSGKGGVGKSTITANLAVALAQAGLAVGVIDADIFGFSIPGLLGLVSENADGIRSAQKPTRVDGLMLPPVAFGVAVISIGMFIDDNSSAIAWRGPMLHRTIKQFLTDVYFDDLDVLLLDLPPGTGDIAISVGQLLPDAEIIVVTTPQPAAADVAERSGIVARQTGQAVFGVIENMSALTQADGTTLDLFGSGGGQVVAARLSAGQNQPVPLLASVPLSVGVRAGGDTGMPVVLSHPHDPASTAIRSVASAIATRGRRASGPREAKPKKKE